jgi:hypothetical protein
MTAEEYLLSVVEGLRFEPSRERGRLWNKVAASEARSSGHTALLPPCQITPSVATVSLKAAT